MGGGAKEKSKMMNYYLVMINARSGGQDGPQLLDKFREVVERGELNGELVSLTDPRPGGGGVIGPGPALRKHRTRNKLRIIACGGDGTVGWILSECDSVEWGDSGPPPIAIVPLGTGNDLSRSLHWGGRYKDRPVKKLLYEVGESEPTPLDRWQLSVTPGEGEKHPDGMDVLPQQISVVNNYFSLGIDAHIALQFHKARNANQEKFTSRTRNLLFYATAGGKDLVRGQYRKLMDDVDCEVELVDGTRENVTERLKEYGAHAILLLNIKSYSGGTRPWKQKPNHPEPSINDGLVEVIALDNFDLPLLQLGGTGIPVAQARRVTLTTRKPVPMQVDGEPLILNPCTVTLSFLNTGNMLSRNRTTYPFRDQEVDEWAARKIQSSFKEYKEKNSRRGSPARTVKKSFSPPEPSALSSMMMPGGGPPHRTNT